MQWIYPLLVAFSLVFISELGDKTQLLVLSFSSKSKAWLILTGVALGSFLSHGSAIMFGSMLGNINNEFIQIILKLITYISFVLFGVATLKSNNKEEKTNNKIKYAKRTIIIILVIAFSIFIGEFGDKTFLASIGLGIQYANLKIPLIIGAILGMIVSDTIAIFLGKILNKKLSSETMQKFSGILFLIFGIIGILNFIRINC